ncbi:N-acetylglucosamine kinase [Arthrobacter sp. TMN-37]
MPSAERPAGICGIDIGGTGCRVAVTPAAGPLDPSSIFTGTGVRIGGSGLDVEELMLTLEPLVAAARDAAGVRSIDTLVLGAASLVTLLRSAGGVHAELGARFGARTTVLASDVVTSHLGALSAQPGVVVAAGTGAVALGTDHAGLWQRVDGWGHLLGDAGSGAWIGARGLDAAYRSYDGRVGGSAGLLERLHERFGAPEDLVRSVYTRQDRAAVLASFVPDVADAATQGCAVALGIFRSAGRELARTATAALLDGLPPRIRWVGGLFEASTELLEEFSQELHRGHMDLDLAAGKGTSLEGALRLGAAVSSGAGPQPREGFLSIQHHPGRAA